ncbi:LacI family DNA-binding transcriptional regulator [Cognatishimia maritima]|uniref:Transcriptional regulator, LacI family n=1 Tax=Cognatishimia maritima TaxID=870908 RepID=A0A1M5N6I3_9RHOB|nr:LacI family DNA-binding transcriptional regulator [Cognatishimia maritima]SHG85075.1 transcriptional regulator, LacI family [Cognatishimia maritima]
MRDVSDKKRANLRDVAKAAGVSVATVSRVLNTPDTVAPKTRENVQRVIADLKFMPSAAARAINSGRTRFVGALVPTLDNAIFASFLSALESTLAAQGLSLVVSTTGEDPQLEVDKARSLINIGAEGLILSGVAHAPELFDLIESTSFPTLATSFFDPEGPLPTIGYDNIDAAEMGIQYLKDQGHRKVAVVHGPVASNDRTRARIEGARSVTGVSIEFHEVPLSFEGAARALDQILSQTERPTAIACMSDVLAIGVLQKLQRLGMAVPGTFSLLGMDDLPIAAHTFPPLSTVHLPVKRMGTAAGMAIAQWLENGTVPKAHRLEPRMVVRESVARLSD